MNYSAELKREIAERLVPLVAGIPGISGISVAADASNPEPTIFFDLDRAQYRPECTYLHYNPKHSVLSSSSANNTPLPDAVLEEITRRLITIESRVFFGKNDGGAQNYWYRLPPSALGIENIK